MSKCAFLTGSLPQLSLGVRSSRKHGGTGHGPHCPSPRGDLVGHEHMFRHPFNHPPDGVVGHAATGFLLLPLWRLPLVLGEFRRAVAPGEGDTAAAASC